MHVTNVKQFTSNFHPAANPVERRSRDLKPQLVILVGNKHDEWDLHIEIYSYF